MLGLTIGSTTISFAADTIEAMISKATLSINGQNVSLQKPILIYEDTTYIPSEAFAKLGYTVNWVEKYGILDLQKDLTYIVGEDGQPIPIDDELLKKILEATSETSPASGLDE